jgi:hypothetical protein
VAEEAIAVEEEEAAGEEEVVEEGEAVEADMVLEDDEESEAVPDEVEMVGQAGELEFGRLYTGVRGNNESYCMMCNNPVTGSGARAYDEEENEYLLICSNGDDCAGGIGNNSYHTMCIDRGRVVPDGDWFCYFCARRDRREDATFRGF